ncbi:SDR family NAD(P)-dependent oxidoreductase [Micromonospora sp. URMC 105]|uniref:SDR family NAD(P)-dependent oxidoreductase n=1 Tax=Micromonospora sp. URMC 105 TaxID=3423413 RepID=UPI003F1B0609
MTENRRITTPFDRQSTADDVLAGVDLTGKRAVVTGAASGIGTETARALAAAGAEVTLAVRDVAAGERAAAEIARNTGNRGLAVAPLDLSDRSSVAAFAAAWRGPLHILVNNAGIMALPEPQRTPEGWELQFATNHLGHFGLACGLHDWLAAAGNARIVAVSSNGHLQSPVVFEDIHYTSRQYDPWTAYGQSKTANVLFAVEATRRWAASGITANAVMPGGIRTNLQRHQTDPDPEIQAIFDRYPWKTVEQGAATSVLAAASPLLEGVGGRYFENVNEAEPYDPELVKDQIEWTGVADYALDPGNAERLWDVSVAMLNEGRPA